MITIVVKLAELPVLVVSDTGASLIDSNVPDNENNERTTGQTKASNSSASATTMITMTTAINK